MARLSLRRVVRSHRDALDAAAALGAPFAVLEPSGSVVFGEAGEGERQPILVEGIEVGQVVGAGAGPAATLLAHLFAAEHEKRALAAETLGRYKELSLLYDMSDALSHVLDVEEVAAMVVEQAHRALGAEASALLLHDVANGLLDPIAWRDDRGGAQQPRGASEGIEGRVLRNGRAELSESEEGGSVMCAPLRSGDEVFGLLYAAHGEAGHWEAGDLKLLSSIAGHSAAAISHARIHADLLRREALRGRIERILSPHLAEAALAGRDASDAGAVVYVDVGGVSSAQEAPETVLSIASCLALDVFLESGATVDASSGDMLVGVFGGVSGFEACARKAVEASVAILGAFDLRFGGRFAQLPGIGVARVALTDGAPQRALVAGVSVAATLQSLSRGRVLCDAGVAGALGDGFAPVPAEKYEEQGDSAQAYEVRL